MLDGAPDWTSNSPQFNVSIPPYENNIINDIRLVQFSFPLSKNNKRCLSSLGRVQFLGSTLHFTHCTPSEISKAWSSYVPDGMVFEKGDSDKGFKLLKQQLSLVVRQFELHVGFEHTDRFFRGAVSWSDRGMADGSCGVGKQF